MSSPKKRVRTSPTGSFKSKTSLAYQLDRQNPEEFTILSIGPADPQIGFECEIFYRGNVKIWQTIGDHRLTINYESKQLVFESLSKLTPSGQWVDWTASPQDESWASGDGYDSPAQIILRVVDNSPNVNLSRVDNAKRKPTASPSAFILNERHKIFARIRLHFRDTSSIRNWRPKDILSLIPEQSHERGHRQEINAAMPAIHDKRTKPAIRIEDLLNCKEAAIPDTNKKLDAKIEKFLNREQAAIKADMGDPCHAAAWMTATAAAFRAIPSSSKVQLPLVPIFLGQGEAIKDTRPFAEEGYLVDFSPLGDIDPSRCRVIQNIFDYQVSLVHVPAGCELIAAIVSATEAILRKAPKTKILICGHTNIMVDKIVNGFTFRELVCDLRFQHLSLSPRETSGLGEFSVIICTYSMSCVDWLKKQWSPHVLIAEDAGRLKYYELLIPVSTYFQSLTRLVLLGDPVQVGCPAETDGGEMEQKKLVFEKLMEEQWPSGMLSVNHLTHSDLCYPMSTVFYRGKMTAVRKTSSPGPFLTQVLKKFAAGLQIIDSSGDATKITSFAHFFDICDPTNLSESPEVSCVDVLVRALLSTGACQMSQIMVVCCCSRWQELLTGEARRSGWDKVAIRTVSTAQGLSTKVAILCLPRDEKKLEDSPMSMRHSVSVMMSLATDVCFIVGKWLSICLLPHTNDLQRLVFCMDETIPNFLLRVGASPYRVESVGMEHSEGQRPNQPSSQNGG